MNNTLTVYTFGNEMHFTNLKNFKLNFIFWKVEGRMKESQGLVMIKERYNKLWFLTCSRQLLGIFDY